MDGFWIAHANMYIYPSLQHPLPNHLSFYSLWTYLEAMSLSLLFFLLCKRTLSELSVSRNFEVLLYSYWVRVLIYILQSEGYSQQVVKLITSNKPIAHYTLVNVPDPLPSQKTPRTEKQGQARRENFNIIPPPSKKAFNIYTYSSSTSSVCKSGKT